MTRINRIVLRIFLGGLALVILSYAVFDAWLVATKPSGSSISWSMALLGQTNPFAVFALGHLTGGILWGLAVHFWPEFPDPDTWDELVKLRKENQDLKEQLEGKP